MNNPGKAAVRRRFNRHAASYDKFASVQQMMADTLLQSMEAYGDQPLHILEIGCGTGALTSRLLAAYPGCHVTALDIAADMAAAAARRTAHYAERRTFIVADIEEWASRQEGQRFDLIISNACFQWLTDKEATLVHLRRQLRAGGRLAAATFGAETFHELHASFRHAYKQAGKPPRRHGLSLLSAEEWVTLLASAHFPGVHVHREIWKETHASVPDFLHSVKSVGAGASEADAPPGLGQRRLFMEMMDYYERKFGVPQGVEATYELLFFQCTIS